MKKIAFALMSLFAVATMFTACGRLDDVQTTQEAVETSEDVVDMEVIFQDVEDDTDSDLETRGPQNDCPIVTFASPEGTFPNTITIDYGTEGCAGPNGHIRRGQIVINVSDTIVNAGAIRVTNLINFSVDDVALEGTRTVTNNGLNDAGLPSFTRTVEGGSATWPDGITATWAGTHTATMTQGFGTATVFDNVFSIVGNANGVNRNGKVWSSQITEPITRKRTCAWASDGIREITVNGNTATIDYGFGDECDRKAMLTLPNGNTRIIVVRH